MTQNTPSPASQPPTSPPTPAAPQPAAGAYPTPAPAPGAVAAAPNPNAGRGLRRAGGWTFWIGLGLTLVAAIFAIISLVMLARIPAQAFESAVHITPGTATTVELSSGDNRLLLWDGSDPETCTVTSPSGADVLITAPQSAYGPNYGPGYGPGPGQPGDYDNAGLVSAGETGAYTVECSGAGAMMVDFGDVGYAVNWSLGVAIAAVVGGLTSLVAVIGGVLWLVGRSQQING